MAGLHADMAARQRETEACHRAAERMHDLFARRLEKWAVRQDRSLMLRPALMAAVANAAGWQGAVLTLWRGRPAERLVAASDATARQAHELEVTLAEGPSWDAVEGVEPAARGPELDRRWPRYGPAVKQLGVRAVAAVPLALSRNLTGSLTVVGSVEPSRTEQKSGLNEVAEALTRTVIHAPDLVCVDGAGMPGLLLFEDEDFQPRLHQAAGMVHQRWGWSTDDAVAAIRAHAYAEQRSVVDVADDVIRGRTFGPAG